MPSEDSYQPRQSDQNLHWSQFVFVLRFYGRVNPIGHVEHSQFTLPHFYWAGLSSKRLTSILHVLSPEKRKGENDCRTSRTHIQLSHRGRHILDSLGCCKQSFFMQTTKTDQTAQMHRLIQVCFGHTSEDMFSHIAAELSIQTIPDHSSYYS